MKTIFTCFSKNLMVLVLMSSIILVRQNIYAQNWSSYGGGVPGWCYSTTVYNNELYAGGDFGILRWNGSTWVSLGTGVNGSVRALAVYNNKLIAGGFFTVAGGKNVNYIAQWDGITWSGLEGGMDSYVVSLTVYNGQLIAGGYFKHANIRANYIAKWDGHAWSPMGSGMSGTEGQVMALAVYGNDLIATGFFTKAGGKTANHIAKWNDTDTTWRPLGSGLSGIGYALTVYNGTLIAGGLFSSAGGIIANDIAKWNGIKWSALGKGIGGGTYGYVFALTLYDSNLIAAGNFTHAGDYSAENVAKWNDTSWSPLATAMSSGGTVEVVEALTTFSGNLIAGGIFGSIDSAGGANLAAYHNVHPLNSISTSPISGNFSCPQTMSISYTATGSYKAANIFTAQLSDGDGRFRSPLNIGSVASTTSGTITVNVPALGTYSHARIRVVSSNPYLYGTDNGSDLFGSTTIIAKGSTTICSGDKVKLVVTTPGISYQWKKDNVAINGATSNTYSAKQSGSYWCEVTKTCNTFISNIISVTVNPAPTSVVNFQPCSAGSVTLNCTANPNTGVNYQWYQDGSAIAGATAATFVATTNGSYLCRVTIIATGCFKDSKLVNVSINCAPVTASKLLYKATAFPNPSYNYFVVNTSNIGFDAAINIYDVAGKLLESHRVNSAETKVGISLNPGIYFAKLELNGQVKQVLKLQKIK